MHYSRHLLLLCCRTCFCTISVVVVTLHMKYSCTAVPVLHLLVVIPLFFAESVVRYSCQDMWLGRQRALPWGMEHATRPDFNIPKDGIVALTRGTIMVQCL
jgi:hypothetical protein